MNQINYQLWLNAGLLNFSDYLQSCILAYLFMKKIFILLQFSPLLLIKVNAQLTYPDNLLQVKVTNGILEGVNESGVIIFKGIPYAQPPVGQLRWKEPQPVTNWKGIRKANMFSPRAMQRYIYSDMKFRSNGISEDCLYLNIWTPAKTSNNRLPVLVYFYGGGFKAGDGSEYRYDGESMARKGIVVITVNYRLGVFGFFAHPELTKESLHHASGNYGLMDQAAALHWVQQNISAFGGDPKKITIAGESAGASSVCALMASPLSRNIIAGAIGESGSVLEKKSVVSLADAEQTGLTFAKSAGVASLSELRDIPAEQLLELTAKSDIDKFPSDVDGYFYPKPPVQIYAIGEQAKVPLMVGWNSEESNYKSILGTNVPTKENYIKALQKRFGANADGLLKAYNPTDSESIEEVATDLAIALFNGFGDRKWIDLQSTTCSKPVYWYFYEHPRPAVLPDTGSPVGRGAAHSAEIEYALGNLPTNRIYDWQPGDYKVSEILQEFFANFIKTGNPNGLGLPEWPAIKSNTSAEVMHINVESKAEKEKHKERFPEMDKIMKQ